jgi:hypothetical protein
LRERDTASYFNLSAYLEVLARSYDILRLMLLLRRTIAIIGLIAILLVAVAPSGTVLLWAIVVPLLFFVATLNPLSHRTVFESTPLPASPFFSNSSSRAPPNF